jgi:NADPH2:quinone reductase
LGLFRDAKLQGGEAVFVHGGTGGVGSMVVQMAKAVGAKVITTVGSSDKAKLCREWGAECVLNYKTEDVPAEVRKFTHGQGVHVWYETQRESDLQRTVDLMAQRGRIVLMAGRQARPPFPVGPFYVKGLGMYGFAMFNATAAEQQRCAQDINRWLAEGKLQPMIGRTFRLAQAANAHRLLEENTLGKAGTLTGKVVLTP